MGTPAFSGCQVAAEGTGRGRQQKVEEEGGAPPDHAAVTAVNYTCSPLGQRLTERVVCCIQAEE